MKKFQPVRDLSRDPTGIICAGSSGTASFQPVRDLSRDPTHQTVLLLSPSQRQFQPVRDLSRDPTRRSSRTQGRLRSFNLSGISHETPLGRSAPASSMSPMFQPVRDLSRDPTRRHPGHDPAHRPVSTCPGSLTRPHTPVVAPSRARTTVSTCPGSLTRPHV